MQTRSQTGHSKPKAFPDYQVLYCTKHPLKILASITLPPEPSWYSIAVVSP